MGSPGLVDASIVALALPGTLGLDHRGAVPGRAPGGGMVSPLLTNYVQYLLLAAGTVVVTPGLLPRRGSLDIHRGDRQTPGMALPTIPLEFERLDPEDGRARARALLGSLRRRRSVRDFSSDPVPLDLVETAIETAATAPSGANRQPWRFVVVGDASVKAKIREAAEAEERAFYEHRATAEWLADLAPLGTDWRKPFLETAPWLIVVFRLDYEPERLADGTTRHHKNYYVQESVGIAVGLLLTALHTAGLATLTHTPSPMGFLAEVLGRPRHERPYLLIPVGYPAPDARVPAIVRKPLDEVRVVV
jgi:nitroreductase